MVPGQTPVTALPGVFAIGFSVEMLKVTDACRLGLLTRHFIGSQKLMVGTSQPNRL